MRIAKILQNITFLAGALLFLISISCERTNYDLLDPESAGKWTHYDTSNGLPGNSVTDITLDSKGNLWLTFQGQGTAMFSENQWTRIGTANSSLPSNTVTCMDVSEAGAIIFGTAAGLSTLKVNNTWDAGLLLSKQVTSVKAASDGAVWVGTAGNGFYVDRGSGFVNVFDETYKNINVIEEDASENVWIGTANGLIKWDGTAYSYLSELNGLPNKNVTALLPDDKDRLWIGTDGGRTVSWIDTKGMHQMSLLNGKDNNHINDIFEDRRGHIWFATAGDGLVEFDGIIPLTLREATNELPENTILSIGEDKNGNLWFGLGSKGVVKYTLPIN